MTEVVFGPVKPPTTDWRWQEVLDMEPHLVMAELQELDSNLFAARSELKEAARELAELVDTLHKEKVLVLEGLRGSLDQGVDQTLVDQLFKGGTKDERKERQEMYLADVDWVKRSVEEIKVAQERKDNAQVAFDSLLDRQANLGRFANMYAATTRLLASIQVPEPVEVRIPGTMLKPLASQLQALCEGCGEPCMDEGAGVCLCNKCKKGVDECTTTLYFVAKGKPPISVSCFGSEDIVVVQRKAKEQGYQEVTTAGYKAMAAFDDPLSGPSDNVWPIFQFAERAKEEIMPPSLHDLCADVRSWMEWHKNPMGSPPVDTAELVDRVVVAGIEKREVVAEATAKTALEDEGFGHLVRLPPGVEIPADDDHDEGEYGALKIPASMELSPDEARAAAAAIGRHGREVQEEESDDGVISL